LYVFGSGMALDQHIIQVVSQGVINIASKRCKGASKPEWHNQGF
jgi:hypothetical protein